MKTEKFALTALMFFEVAVAIFATHNGDETRFFHEDLKLAIFITAYYVVVSIEKLRDAYERR